MHLRIGFLLAVVVSALAIVPTSNADTRWTSFIPFRKSVEADPGKRYELTEDRGPWLILAASFAGKGAEQQAHELVLELREKFNLPAYINQKQFDYTETVEGKSIDRYTGGPAKMKYANAMKFEAYSVLAGEYESPKDPKIPKTLEMLKYARPKCLDEAEREQGSAQWMVGIRKHLQQMNGNPAKRSKGPMGNAFVTRNPHLPETYFAPGGIDDFVVKLNEHVKYSLLRNPGRYTVKVASFSGKDTMDNDEIELIERTGKFSGQLEIAADKAHRLTVALRSRGVDAYEFHDRSESYVTVGSFESVGEPLPNGAIDINPTIHKIMKMYGATPRKLPGGGSMGLQPRTLAGIRFDIQAMPVEVPRRSIASDYARAAGR